MDESFISLSLKITAEELETLSKKGIFIYKPLCGGQGRDIEVFKLDNDVQLVHRQLQHLPGGIVEEWIEQDVIMSMLYPDEVNPIRIQTLYTDEVNIIAATLTVANGTRIANASATHAIFALVDVKSGVVISDGCDYDGDYYILHPVTNIGIKGFQIPYWEKVINLVTETAQRFQHVRHVGWDVAISKDGPIIIEGNNDPGYTAYQLPMLTQTHTGILPLYQDYM